MGADVYPTAFSVPRWSGKPTHSFGCCATQSAPIIIRFSRRVQMWKGILAKIRPEPPKESLGPEGLEPKREPLRTQTL